MCTTDGGSIHWLVSASVEVCVGSWLNVTGAYCIHAALMGHNVPIMSQLQQDLLSFLGRAPLLYSCNTFAAVCCLGSYALPVHTCLLAAPVHLPVNN